MSTRLAIALTVSGLLLGLGAVLPGAAAWADDDHGLPHVEDNYDVSPREALPGGEVTVKVTCLFEGVPCTGLLVALYSTTDNTIETGEHILETPDHPFDKNGKFEHTFTIPHDVTPGTYDFTLSAFADDMALGNKYFDFTVLDPNGEQLAKTGWYPGRKKTAAGAAFVVLLGSALLLRGRRLSIERQTSSA